MNEVERELKHLLSEFEESSRHSAQNGNIDGSLAWDSAIDELKEVMSRLGVD